MKKLFYVLAFILIAISVFFNVSAYAGGAGGSWDCPDGFQPDPNGGCKGAGGSTGGSGGGGSWGNSDGFGGNSGSSGGFDGGGYVCPAGQDPYSFAQKVCSQNSTTVTDLQKVLYQGKVYFHVTCAAGHKGSLVCSPHSCPSGQESVNGQCVSSCPDGSIRDANGQCQAELQCPAGYKKEGGQCVWQCPAGYKDMGGSCVPDDQPEDCDPAIQECNEDGTPKCDPCSKLQQLINNNLTMINNDNRVISLTETLVSNQNTTNNNINNVNNTLSVINNNMNTVNNNISNVNNNLTTINESIQNIITSIENNKPDFDTSGIESKLQQLIDKQITVDSPNIEMDFTPLITKLEELNQSIIANKYDDTELKLKIDELINKDLSAITDRQDEQTSLLEDIKRLLMPTNEAGDPSLDLPEVEESSFDAWGAIKGFNINQNIINASSQCPADKSFTINLLVKSVTFAIPMTPMCSFLGYLAPVFLALAYFQGAMIILKAGD